MKKTLQEIEQKIKKQSFLTLDEVKEEIDNKWSGYYWIYTSKTLTELKESKPPQNKSHVNISKLVRLHENLKLVCPPSNEEFWCIYNGKAKELKKRIIAEFSNTKSKTGTLALKRCFKESDFRIKYIICSNKEHKNGIKENYKKTHLKVERIWRLNNAWPILCKS